MLDETAKPDKIAEIEVSSSVQLVGGCLAFVPSMI